MNKAQDDRILPSVPRPVYLFPPSWLSLTSAAWFPWRNPPYRRFNISQLFRRLRSGDRAMTYSDTLFRLLISEGQLPRTCSTIKASSFPTASSGFAAELGLTRTKVTVLMVHIITGPI